MVGQLPICCFIKETLQGSGSLVTAISESADVERDGRILEAESDRCPLGRLGACAAGLCDQLMP